MASSGNFRIIRRAPNISFGCFNVSAENSIRDFCISVVHSHWFETFIVTTILANCFVMAMDKDETETLDGSMRWDDYTEWVF
jgi:hypothetical protein